MNDSANGGRAAKPLTSYDKAFAYIRLNANAESAFVLDIIFSSFTVVSILAIIFLEHKLFFLLTAFLFALIWLNAHSHLKWAYKKIDVLNYVDTLRKKKW